MKMPRALVLTPFVLALAACFTVGPDYSVPKDAVVNAPFANAPLDGAQGQSTVSSGPVPAHWWRLYDDPVLDDLVQQAMASNTDRRVGCVQTRAGIGGAILDL